MTTLKLSLAVAVFVALISLSMGAHINNANCRQSYQDTLNKALRIKGECDDDAVLYDCCQAKAIHIHNVPSAQYDIGEVCPDFEPFERSSVMLARCDMETDGGGWLVIQRRANDSSINFYRGWNDYEQGFGDLDSEFWYGLKNIHCLTTRDEVELRIDLEDESGNKVTWVYQLFRVAGPEDKYRLTIGPGEGPPGTRDPMTYHNLNGQQFSTFDQDNDAYGGNCAQRYRGAWWYNFCTYSNLNGDHGGSGDQRPAWHDGIHGRRWVYYPYIEMKIRRKTCSTAN